MKTLVASLLMSVLLMPMGIQAQNKKSLKTAEYSYKMAVQNYKKEHYTEAAQQFNIVADIIPFSSSSKSYVEMRLESLIKLVDIHFYRSPNFTLSCNYLQEYSRTVDHAQRNGVLSKSLLYKYLKQLKEFEAKEAKQCDSYQRIDVDMDSFRDNVFDKVFDEE